MDRARSRAARATRQLSRTAEAVRHDRAPQGVPRASRAQPQRVGAHRARVRERSVAVSRSRRGGGGRASVRELDAGASSIASRSAAFSATLHKQGLVARDGGAQARRGAHVPALPASRRRSSTTIRARWWRRRSATVRMPAHLSEDEMSALIDAPAGDSAARAARSRDPRAVLRVGPAPERARRPRCRRCESEREDGARAREGRQGADRAVQRAARRRRFARI